MSKLRLNYIDSAKGLGILLVILNHILPANNSVVIWLSTFHMPLFFIISGFLLSISDSWKTKSTKENIIHKAKNLLVPYFLFCTLLSVLIIIYSVISSDYSYNHIISDIIKQTIFFEGYGPMWFLFTLFFAEIAFIYLRKSRISSLVILSSSVLLTIVISSINPLLLSFTVSLPLRYLLTIILDLGRCFLGISFIQIGYSLSNIINSSCDSNKKNLVISSSLILILLNILFFNINGIIIVSNLQLNNFFLFYFVATIISLSYLLLFKFLHFSLLDQILSFFGRNSLIIMCTHETFFIIAFSFWLANIIHINISYKYIFIFLLTCSIEVLLILSIKFTSRYLIKNITAS